MNDKDKERIIRHYDVEELRKDIKRHEANIKNFLGFLNRAERLKDDDNIKIFSEAIRSSRAQILDLKGYIKLIEENRNGD